MQQEYPELAPISEGQPAGADIRYEPEFEQLQGEIDKLSLPSATAGIDWGTVRDLASAILRSRSKDLLVASYLSVAELRLNKLSGLADGLAVIAGLLEHYWETLFPAKKRMRGRLAAIVWLLEKSEGAAESIDFEPADPDQVLQVRRTIERIDAALQQHLEDPPLLRPLERIIDSVPIRQSSGDQGPAGPQQKQPDPAAALQDHQTAAQQPGPERAVEQAKQEESARAEPVKVEPAPSVSTSGSTSAAEMEKILRGAFQTVRQAADFYFDKDQANPRGYRCRRTAGWAMIQSLPPANDSQTQIPPPGEFEATKLRLQELRSLEKWPQLLSESELRLNSALLWLDLNRFSADALSGLGAQYQEAHDAICQETGYLLTRLPGLEKLKFADGSPLADAETRQWLESLQPAAGASVSVQASAGAQTDERMAAILEEAKSLAKGKKLAEAIRLLTVELGRSPARHERLLWRLGLAQLLIQFRQLTFARPHLDEVVRELERYRVEEWEPALAIHALRVVWLGYRSDKTNKELADDILARIARLDPAEAMALEKR